MKREEFKAAYPKLAEFADALPEEFRLSADMLGNPIMQFGVSISEALDNYSVLDKRVAIKTAVRTLTVVRTYLDRLEKKLCQ